MKMKVHRLDDVTSSVVPLTELQQRAIDFIGASYLQGGGSVSLDQLQKELQVPRHTVRAVMDELERLGLVTCRLPD